MAFHYQAINGKGGRCHGVIEAETERQACSRLREQGFTVLNLRAATEQPPSRFLRIKRVSAQDLVLITRQMATLLAAALPLDEVLAGVAEQHTKPSVKSIILQVRGKVMEGHTLAAAMSEFPRTFSRLYRTTVAAGEKTGQLAEVLTRLAEYSERQRHIKRKVQHALIYPTLMCAVSVLVVMFMLIYVVPKIITVFSETHQVLPLATRMMLWISQFLQNDGVYCGIVLVLGVYGFSRLLRRDGFRATFQYRLLKLPLFGKLLGWVNSARFARTLGILQAAGVPLLEAMNCAAQLIQPIPMRTAVQNAIAVVREGGMIHQALRDTGYFTPMFLHLIASGEASGTLDVMLQKAASEQEAQFEAWVDGGLTLFEPLMILLMGGVVMFIVLAVMLPIFALDNVNVG